ncbi:MAG TPA: hypothetical protein VGH53_06940 [Streptosporangiaceae bacterium]
MSAEDAVPGMSERPAREKAKTPRSEFEAFTREDLALLYLRQARTALVALAVLAFAVLIAYIAFGIINAISVAHLAR